MHGLLSSFCCVLSQLDSIITKKSYFYSVVNVASRAGMLDSIKNAEIRYSLTAPDATIDTVSDILSDFIK
jgi:hypothetical protein